MSKKLPILYGALTLTAVNLLLRFIGTSFQVYISAKIGAAGVGLLQLILSVGVLSMTAGIAGSRTATMYLCAEELGRRTPEHLPWVMRSGLLYCGITSAAASFALLGLAPRIAAQWITDPNALPALRLLGCFLPISCLCGVMTGYFTAASRIGTLAAVETAEQFCSMAVTVSAFILLGTDSPADACAAVILGGCIGNLLTLVCLTALYLKSRPAASPRLPTGKRLMQTAVPLALADDLKAGISALENLMVPRRLALYSAADPMAGFGMISGMIFPVMMFPAAILYSLSELLIPELARCAAAGSDRRIRYLVRRNLRVCLFYGVCCGALLFITAEPLCGKLYTGIGVARYLKWFSLLVPMLYCDAIIDGMTKGLGQQVYCVRYNILTNTLDVALLYLLLPKLGLEGYFFSFALTHLINFLLSLRRLILASGIRINIYHPAVCLLCAGIAMAVSGGFTGWVRRSAAFLGLFFVLSYHTNVFGSGELRWLKGLLRPGKNSSI